MSTNEKQAALLAAIQAPQDYSVSSMVPFVKALDAQSLASGEQWAWVHLGHCGGRISKRSSESTNLLSRIEASMLPSNWTALEASAAALALLHVPLVLLTGDSVDCDPACAC